MAGDRNQRLRELISLAREVASESPVYLDVEEKAERVLLVQQLRNVCDSVRVSAVEAAELGGVAAAAKMRTVAQFVGAEAGVDPRRVRADARIGGWLRSFPLFEQGFASGELSLSHLDKLKGLFSPRTYQAMLRDQQVLVDAARTCSFADFVKAAQYWLTLNDPDGELPKEQVRNAGVRIKKLPDGSIEGSFVLDPLRGQAFCTAFDREMQRQLEADSAAEVERSNYQRGADALVGLVARGHAAATSGPIVPLINIVVGAETAAEIIARIAGESEDPDGPWPVDADAVDRRCETIDGTPIHPWFVLAAMSVGRFQRHIFKPGGREISQSSKLRSFPPDLKHILMVQARGQCATPGCDAPFSWLHADHVYPHSEGGQTTLVNGQPQCGPDNRWKTNRTDLGRPGAGGRDDQGDQGDTEERAA